MRIQVNMLGRFAFKIQFSRCTVMVQIVVNFDCKRLANTAYFHQVIDTCAAHALQPPKLFQQFPAPLRFQAGDFLETRSLSCFGPPQTVACNRKPVRLISDSLNNVQRR